MIKKHISKIIIGLILTAIGTAGSSVLKVERLDEAINNVKKDLSSNDAAHSRIEKKVDFIIEKLLDNRD